MKKALITGITGQDGAYLAKLLLEKDYLVHGFAPRRSSENIWRLEYLDIGNKITFISGDVTCSASVTTAVKDGQYDEIYNLAAQSFVGESFNSPTSTFAINAVGTLNLLEAIRQHSFHTRFYQASTSELFGQVKTEFQDEQSTFHPRSPYGVSKLAAHWSTINYREAYDMYTCCGILFNHESPLRGKEFVTRKITNGIADILSKSDTTVLRLGNLDALRDWGYAGDYVEAMWRMLQEDKAKEYVIATGYTYSIREFCKAAFSLVGLNYEEHVLIDDKFKRPSEVNILCGDPLKAAAELGWAPTKSLEQLIHMMLEADLERYGLSMDNYTTQEKISA